MLVIHWKYAGDYYWVSLSFPLKMCCKLICPSKLEFVHVVACWSGSYKWPVTNHYLSSTLYCVMYAILSWCCMDVWYLCMELWCYTSQSATVQCVVPSVNKCHRWHVVISTTFAGQSMILVVQQRQQQSDTPTHTDTICSYV